MNPVYKKLALLVTVLLFLSATAVPMVSADTESDSDEKVIMTSASGEVMATPDRAQLTFSVQTENADVKIAQQENARIMDGLVRAIQGAGIAKEDIKTVRYSIYPYYEDASPFGQKIKYYQVTSSVQITMRDVGRTGEIIDIAVANGANQVDSINFLLSEELEQSLRAEVLTKAVDRTKTDADAVAAAIGMRIIGVKEVSVGQSYSPVLYQSARYESDAAMKGAGVPTPIEPGELKVSAQVSVTYLIQ
ncbi:MAG TPA: SIMPL domain-containing protein [Methanoregulaceae archaeon]|nr:SIMPL domain-containing protein [Methanoregulaceae archaeon]